MMVTSGVPVADTSAAAGDGEHYSYTINVSDDPMPVSGTEDGSWEFDRSTGYGPFNSFYALFDKDNGNFEYILNPYNLAQRVGGTPLTSDELLDNVMWVLPTVYWSVDGNGVLTLSNDSSGKAYAHTFIDSNGNQKTYQYLAIGVYDASKDSSSRLGSVTGDTPLTGDTLEHFRNFASNAVNPRVGGSDPGETMVWNFYQWQLYKYLAYVVMGGFDSQKIVGSGNVEYKIIKNGTTDQSGPYAGSPSNSSAASKLFIENPWGNVWQFVDGFSRVGDTLYLSQNGSSATDWKGNPADHAESKKWVLDANNWVSDIDTDHDVLWGIPKDLDGSEDASGTGDFCWAKSSSNDPECLYVGGASGSGHEAGISAFRCKDTFEFQHQSIGTRLAFMFDDDSSSPRFSAPDEKFTYQLTSGGSPIALEVGGTEKDVWIESVIDRNGNRTVGASGSNVLGSWGFDSDGHGPFNSFYALFDGNTGGMLYRLDPNDLSKRLGGGDADLDGNNVMWVLPTVYWKTDGGSLVLSNDKDSGGTPYAHSVDGKTYDYIALGVYEATVSDGKMGSVSSVTPWAGQRQADGSAPYASLNDFTKYADNAAKPYVGSPANTGKTMVWNFYQWELYKYISYSVMGGFGSQEIIGEGRTAGNNGPIDTGTMNGKGPYYGAGATEGSKLLIENSWGNLHEWVGGFLMSGSEISLSSASRPVLSDAGGQSFRTGSTTVSMNAATALSEGYVTMITTGEASLWGFPSVTSQSQPEDGRGTRDRLLPSEYGGRIPDVGGMWGNGDAAGISYAEIQHIPSDSYSEFGSRLAYAFDAAPDMHALVYDTNGDGAEAPEGGMHVPGEIITVPDLESSRAGYTLSGWNVKADGSDAANYAPGKTFEMPDREFTLYAHWEQIMVDVSFAPNYDGGEISGLEVGYDAPYSLPVGPERAGYDFDGWFTSAAGGTKVVSPDAVTTDTTYYAHWTAKTFDAGFDANYDGAAAIGSVKQTYGSNHSLPEAPSRTGYAFAGWFTDPADGKGAEVTASTKVETTGPATYYAHWTPAKVGATFVPNYDGGTAVTVTQTYGGKYALPDAPTRTGYTFEGWYDASGAAMPQAVTITEPATYYARWEPVTYHITFVANGGSGSMSQMEVRYGQEATLDKNKFTLTGHHFTGWEASVGGKESSYPDGWHFTYNVVGDLTLTAQWEANGITVAYLANGGAGSMGLQEFSYGSPATAEECAFTYAGHHFAGWKYNGGIIKAGDPLGKVTGEGAALLVAQWEANPITVHYASGEGSGAAMEDQKFSYGDIAAAASCTYANKGHTFAGWKLDGTRTYAAGDDIGTIAESGEVTLTAQWSPVTYHIRYMPNGGAGEERDADAVYGSAATVAKCPFARDGYTFDGWNTRPDGKGQSYAAEEGITSYDTAGDLALYAQWASVTYHITFDANEGSGTMSRIDAVYGQSVALDKNDGKIVREGYVFMGWNTQSDGRGTPYSDGQVIESYGIAGDLNLFAVWDTHTYKVTYHANGPGGTEISGKTQGLTEEYGERITLGPNGFAVTGYDFKGWNSQPDGKGQPYADGREISVPAHDLDLYAVWEIHRYAASFAGDSHAHISDIGGVTDGTVEWHGTVTFTVTVDEGYEDKLAVRNGTTDLGNTARTYTIENIDDDVEVTAYTEANRFTVTYKVDPKTPWGTVANGTVENVPFGTPFFIDGNVSKVNGIATAATPSGETDGYTYAFAAFSVANGDVVNRNITVTVTFQQTPRTYDVTLNWDGGKGTDLAHYTYGVGAALPADGIKAQDDRHTFVFEGWYAADDTEGSRVTEISGSDYGDREYTAKWREVPRTYSVTLDWNGGSGTNLAQYTCGVAADLPADGIKAQDDGYTYDFGGWIGADGKSAKSIPATATGDLSFRAEWNGTARAYSVTLVPGDHASIDDGKDVGSYTYGKGAPLPAAADLTYERTGYAGTFAGWFTAADGGSPVAKISGDDHGDVVLYAHWTEKANGYTVTFTDPQFNVQAVPLALNVTYGQPYGTLPVLEKEGYSFEGWQIGGKAVGPGSVVSITQNADAVAVWEPVSVTATFVPNHDGGKAVTLAETYGKEYALPDAPTRAGYTFAGWYDASVGGSKADLSGSSVLTAPATYYAHWTVVQYTIEFETGDGTAVKSITQDFGSAVAAPDAPTRTGYSFAGWDREVPAIMPAESMTITAQWKINQYTIEFDTDGGTAVKDITQDFGTEIKVPDDPTKKGYTFAGWDRKVPATMPAEDMTITAQWTPVHFTAKFDQNYPGAKPVPPVIENYGSSYNLPSAELTRTGYTFAGWFTARAGGDEVTASTTVETTADTTYYAHWDPVTVRVMFDPNYAGKDVVLTEQTFGRGYVLPGGPARDGYGFDGWFTARAGGDEVTASTAVGSVGPVTLYAHWTAKQFTVTFVSGNAGYGSTSPSEVKGVPYGTALSVEGDTLTVNGSIVRADPAEDTRQYHYAFRDFTVGDGHANGHVVTGDVTVTANFDRTVKEYTVYFQVNNGAWGKVDAEKFEGVPYNTPVEIDGRVLTIGGRSVTATPTGDDVQYQYAFEGFSAKDEDPVTGNVIIEVDFGQKLREYTVSIAGEGVIVSADGKEIANGGKVPYGVVITVSVEDREGYTKSVTASSGTVSGGLYSVTGDVTFTGSYTADTCTITFDTAGGSEIGSITQKFGTEIEVPEDPTKKGYTFAGWDREVPATMPAEDMTITAHWTANQIRVHYAPGDGSGEAMHDQTFEYGNRNVVASGCAYSYTGHSFREWKADDGRTFAVGTAIGTIAESGEVTLTAQWDANRITVHYAAGKGAGDGMPDYTFKYGEKAAAATCTYVLEGHHVLCWADADGRTVEEGASISTIALSGEVTLTAQWAPNVITVEYAAGQGSGEMRGPSFSYGSAAEAAECSFVREGYSFTVWTKEDGTEVPAGSDIGKIAGSGKVVLTAQWSPNKYTISYNANGGTGGPMQGDEVAFHGPATLRKSIFEREGFTFTGWNTEPDGSGTAFSDGQSTDSFSYAGGLALYAMWEPKTYHIDFGSNPPEGMEATGKMADQPIVYGKRVEIKANAFAVPGYEFVGWDMNGDGKANYSDRAQIIMPASDLHLSAVWRAVTYSATFAGDGNARITDITGVDGDERVPMHGTVTFKVAVDEGYGDRLVVKNGGDVLTPDASSGIYTIEDVLAKVVVTASTGANTYTVTYKVDPKTPWGTILNGTVENVPFGAYFFIDGNSSRVGNTTTTATPLGVTDEFTYSFERFSVANGDPVTGDTEVTVTFGRATNTYDVTFTVDPGKAWGTMSQTVVEDVPYGSSIAVDGDTATVGGVRVVALPQDADAHYTYGFAGFSIADGETTGKDTNVVVGFDRKENEYDVSVAVDDGTPWGTLSQTVVEDVPYGSSIAVDGDTITVNGVTVSASPNGKDAGHEYSFGSWSVRDGYVVVGDTHVHAVFKETQRTYTVTFSAAPDGQGTVDREKVENVPYGTLIAVIGSSVSVNGTTVTAIPADADEKVTYSFGSWSVADRFMVIGDKEIVANFTSDPTQYVIEIADGVTVKLGGAELANGEPVDYGAVLTVTPVGGRDGYVSEALASVGSINEDGTYTVASDVTFYPVHTPIEYALTFDTDGGSDVGKVVAGYGEPVSAPADPEKTGYTFAGWDHEFPKTMPLNGDSFTARWEPCKYAVLYLPNGGTGNTNPTQAVYGEDAALAGCGFKYAGHTFAGWNTMPDGSGDQYSDTIGGYPYPNPIVLFAQWDTDTYGVTFAVDEKTPWGTLSRTSVEDVPYGTALSIDGNKMEIGGEVVTALLTKEKDAHFTYRFEGFTVSGGYTVNGPTEVVAHFGRSVNEYDVTFAVEGKGTVTNNSVRVPYGSVFTVDGSVITVGGVSTMAVPQKADAQFTYGFAGFSVDSSAVTSDTKVAVTSDTEVTVSFDSTVNAYDVTFRIDPDTPWGRMTQMVIEDVPYGSAVTVSGGTVTVDGRESSAVPDAADGRHTYAFAGFPADADDDIVGDREITVAFSRVAQKFAVTVAGEGVSIIGKDGAEIASGTMLDYGTEISVSVADREGYVKHLGASTGILGANGSFAVAGPVTFTGSYSPASYTIKFDSDGGSEVGSITLPYGSDVTVPGVPTKTGYTFGGWSPALPESMPAHDVAVTAQWNAVEHTIGFDTDGGSEVGSITLPYGTEIALPEAPSKTGYTFAGWDGRIPATMPDGDMTFTAQWTVNRYTISFDTDGGTGVRGITADFGSRVTAPEAPAKAGHTFAGWSPELPETMPAGNTELKALWKVNQYDVTYSAGDNTYITDMSVVDGGKVDWHGSVSFKAAADAGYGSLVVMNGSEVLSPDASGVYTVGNVEGNVSITSSATLGMCKVTYVIDSSTPWGRIVNPVVGGVPYGSVFAIDGSSAEVGGITSVAVPMADDANYSYAFAGFSAADGDRIEGDVSVTVTFARTVNEYTVHIAGEGVSVSAGGTALEDGSRVAYGTVLAVSVADREGFGGSVKADPGEIEGGEYTVRGDVTFTGSYAPISYTMTFDAAGGSAVGDITLPYGSGVAAPDEPVRRGYEFAGWSPELPKTMPARDTSYVALWTPVVVSAIFEGNFAGSEFGETVAETFGQALELPGSVPSREGYAFAGWFTSASGGVPAEGGVVDFTEPATFYARWTVMTFTVTFVSGDPAMGSVSAGSVENVPYGSRFSFSDGLIVVDGRAVSAMPSEGYEARGWSGVPDFVASDVTVTAVFGIEGGSGDAAAVIAGAVSGLVIVALCGGCAYVRVRP